MQRIERIKTKKKNLEIIEAQNNRNSQEIVRMRQETESLKESGLLLRRLIDECNECVRNQRNQLQELMSKQGIDINELEQENVELEGNILDLVQTRNAKKR